MLALLPSGFNEAAAYHCGKPAASDCWAAAADWLASMRPQHITAENPRPRWTSRSRATRFNEAAAYHCGKPPVAAGMDASMARGFNEAAAYHCGKPGAGVTTRCSTGRSLQ